MPFFADLTLALAAALVTFLAARWYAASPNTPDRPTEDVARAVGEAAGDASGLERFRRPAARPHGDDGFAPHDGACGDVPRRPAPRGARAARPPRCGDPACRQLGRRVGLRPPKRDLDARTALGHRLRQHPDRRRPCSPARPGRPAPPPEPLVVPLPSGGARRHGGLDAQHQRVSSGGSGRRSRRRPRRSGRRSRAATRQPRQRSTRQRR